MNLTSQPGFLRRVAARWRRYAPLKLAGTIVWISVFFIGYFQVLRETTDRATIMPLTPLDSMIGFQPAALIPYLSLWFYLGWPPALFLGLRELLAYGMWAAALCATGLLIFYIWPTAVPPSTFDAGSFPGFSLIQGLDAAGNACPSMHVASAIFSAIWLHRLIGEMGGGHIVKALNWLWFVAIAYSTVATRQHVVLDVVGGLLLGALFAWLSLRFRPQAGH